MSHAHVGSASQHFHATATTANGALVSPDCDEPVHGYCAKLVKDNRVDDFIEVRPWNPMHTSALTG